MKNNKPVSGKAQSGDIGVFKNPVSSCVVRTSKTVTDKSLNSLINLRKHSSSVKSSLNTFGSSQESLTGSFTSVRRKNPPVTKSASLPAKPKSDCTPIRTISNIQSTKSNRKLTFKHNQGNMRRTMSKDRVDLSCNKEREKENVKLGRNQNKNSNNCVTILQLEKDKGVMEQQISELVRNAESKKAEIATLKMEINKLKDLQSDDAVEQLRQELEALQFENQTLKERLVQLGAPLEMTALSDNQKEQMLRKSSIHNSLGDLEESQLNLPEAAKLPEMDVGEASGVSLPPSERPLSDWDKASSSSQSEMSVACLQDRIMQMEETHHSTNEELQATLQELTDLQDQLTDLQLENDRMSEEKAVLLESLCSQTEKLEECRSQITQLKQLLFQQQDQEGQDGVLSSSEREKHLVDLLKKAQETQDLLLLKQEELTSALQAAQKDIVQNTDLLLLRDRVRLLESTVESIRADKRLLESQFRESQEQLSANQIEISQLKLQLENEQQKVSELQREREAGATSELNALLQETRKDKEKVEERVMRLQEQLALSQREVTRYKDQLTQMQEENMVAKNNARKQVSDMEYKIEQIEAEKNQLHKEMAILDEALRETELKCQHHLEDKRELKATIGELQKTVTETNTHLKDVQKEMEEMKKRHQNEVTEWNKFQTDLLTTVRVANDFKTEAQQDVEKFMAENKQLREKIASLESEMENLKKKQEAVSAVTSHQSVAFISPEVATLSNVEKDISTAAARRQLTSSKRSDRGANQLSVKCLIESIENANKQAKGQGPVSSCSSSTSSINSVTSDTRSAANNLFFNNGTDVFIKPSLRASNSDATTLLRESKTNGQIDRITRNSSTDNLSYSVGNSATLSNEQTPSSVKLENDIMKPLTSHPVSILANKLDPGRRNSYGDIAEKKDPLVALIKGGGSKRNALLKWCQNKTMGYKGIDITNFSSSWNDGLAFCALIHSYLPDLIPYQELDNKDKRRNFTLAFKAAESVGIPSTLNINDLISQERPDWQSIMSYVTSIYKHFET